MNSDLIQRRSFLTLLGGAAAAWPVAARAQQPAPIWRMAVLMTPPESDMEIQGRLAAFWQRLGAFGWTAGRNLQVDIRWQADNSERSSALAREVLSLMPDLVMVGNTIPMDAVERQSRSVPILFLSAADPVETGLVQGYAHPGGNITGFINFETQTAAKWLQLLKEIAPDTTVAMVLMQARNRALAAHLRVIQGAAPSFGVRIIPGEVEVSNTTQIERAINSFAEEQPNGGLVVIPGPVLVHRELVAALAMRHRLPAVYPYRFYTESGGLLSYGVDPVDIYRRGAVYADRILRGANPGDLPIQVPTKFEMVLNLKTAKALGIEVPLSLLIRVDDVIE